MSQVSQVAQLEVFVGGLPKVSGKAGDFGCGVGFQEWSMDSMYIASPFICVIQNLSAGGWMMDTLT